MTLPFFLIFAILLVLYAYTKADFLLVAANFEAT